MPTTPLTPHGYLAPGHRAASGFASPAGNAAGGDDQTLKVTGENDGWIISYIDILTLLLTLFVVLFALDHFRPEVEPSAPLTLAVPSSPAPPTVSTQTAPKTAAPRPVIATASDGDLNPTPGGDLGHVGETPAAPADPVEQASAADTPTDAAEVATETAIASLPLELPFAVPPMIVDSTFDSLFVPTPVALSAELDSVGNLEEAGADAAQRVPTPPHAAGVADTDASHESSPSPSSPEAQAQDQGHTGRTASSPAALAVEAPAETATALPEAYEALARALARTSLAERADVAIVDNRIRLEIRDHVLFDVGSAAVKPAGQHTLSELVNVLSASSMLIAVEGHTDNTPIHSERFPSNWELSSARATNVTRFFIDNGVAPGRIRAVGYADTRPLGDNAQPAGRARNRRVSVVLENPSAPPIDHVKTGPDSFGEHRSQADTTTSRRARVARVEQRDLR